MLSIAAPVRQASGLFSSLAKAQQAMALSYQGEENHRDLTCLYDDRTRELRRLLRPPLAV